MLKWIHQTIVYSLKTHFKIFTSPHPSNLNYYITNFAKSQSGSCIEKPALNQDTKNLPDILFLALPFRDAPDTLPSITAINNKLRFAWSEGYFEDLFGESAPNTVLVLFSLAVNFIILWIYLNQFSMFMSTFFKVQLFVEDKKTKQFFISPRPYPLS